MAVHKPRISKDRLYGGWTCGHPLTMYGGRKCATPVEAYRRWVASNFKTAVDMKRRGF